MKKTLLLSVVASTMIMAGGDIAPVEPVVETPVVAATGWDFNGNAVAYYQTNDNGDSDLGSGDTSFNDFAVQLRATNKDLFYGIGAGIELTGLYSGATDWTQNRLQNGGNDGRRLGGGVTQAYLTYGIGNTSIKLGRQHLPKGLSPFAFTEGWQPIKNSFDAALVVNSDIQDTTLVYAYVAKSNGSMGDITAFDKVNKNGDGVHMLTAQNKSIDGLTLTGSYYYAPDFHTNGDAHILWGDAKFAISDYALGLQGGYVMGDAVEDKETTAFGAKAGANFGIFDASAAFSYVGDKDAALPIHNLGTDVKTPLYTQMILNQGIIKTDSSYIKVAAGAEALGGKFGVAYGMRLAADSDALDDHNPYELDVTYKTKVFNDSTTLFAGYVLTDADVKDQDSNNMIRVWGRYNF